MNLVGPSIGVLAAQGQPLVDAQLLLARVAVDEKQSVHARDHVDRRSVLGIHFRSVNELAARMCPTTDVHHLRPADVVVGLIAVGLQNALPLTQELLRALASSAQLKLETFFTPGRAVLP